MAVRRYRSALITGSSSGIGAAFARALPPETDLLLAGRDTESLDRIAVEVAAPGRRVETLAQDLASVQGRRRVIEAAQRCSIDLLVCNAGVGTAGNFSSTSDAVEYETIAVNVVATLELLHALIPAMLERARSDRARGGVVVVSSRAAFEPAPGLASYAASKAFQLRLVDSIAAELKGEPLDLLAVCPTYTESRFFERAGLAPPPWWVTADSVASEALSALGNKSVLVCYGPHNKELVARMPRRARQIARWVVRRMGTRRDAKVG